MMHSALAILILAVGAASSASGQDLSFATVPEARKLLSTRDAFVARMSPFDRSARMKTDREVPEAEYLAFAAAAAMQWSPDEIKIVQAAFSKVKPAIAQSSLPLPSSVTVIKTSGLEEGNAAYTREKAIILPQRELASDELPRLLAHELFHIASRQNPKLAEALYATIGFRHCGEAEIPAELAPLKITNPDAPRNDYCIDLKLGQERIVATPLLLSRSPKYDVSRGGEFFEYLQLAYLVRDDRAPRLVGLQDVSGFFEQVGRNTEYIIHPEEILAENFALLIQGARDVPSPEVLTRMRAALEQAD